MAEPIHSDQEVIEHLAHILAGTFALTMDDLALVEDPEHAELLAGLLFLHEDLQQQRLETRQAQQERDQAHQAALHRSQQRFELVMSQVDGLFWVLDHDLIFLAINGATPPCSEPDQPNVGVALDSVVSNNDPLFLASHAATLGTQSTLDWVWQGRTYQATIAPYALSPNEPIGAAVVAFDVTQQRQLQARGHQSSRLESLGQLAGGVAHDFNNLLTIIKGTAYLLEDELTTPDILEDVRLILETSDRAARLVQQLLAFGRRQFRSPEVVELNTLVAETCELLVRTIGEDIELVECFGEGTGQVNVDRTQLEQVLVNLVMNGVEAMPEGGSLSVETSNLHLSEDKGGPSFGLPPGNYSVVTISDTGVGMNRETLQHAFEPFFTTKDTGSGTGLGLATAYGIVRQTGGDITVYSEPGHGTTFKVYLPSTLQIPTPAPDDLPAQQTQTALSILFVEDEPAVRTITERILRAAGHAVATASGPSAAIELTSLWSEAPDLLITDVVMPGMNGRQLAEVLRSRWPNLPVLYISGYSENVVVKQGVLVEECHMLTKPFRPDDLQAKLQEVFHERDL